MRKIHLGRRAIGEGEPCYVIAEVGINHNGSLDTAKRLIDAARVAGADAVKFQKRTVEVVYARAPYAAGYLEQPREHPLGGEQTQRGQKHALELDRTAWERLAMHARSQGLDFTASCWDEQALADVLSWVDPPWLKVASPCVYDRPLLLAHVASELPLVVSTGGLSREDLVELDHELVVLAGGSRLAYLHCCSVYPATEVHLNLRAMDDMRELLPDAPIGYSGHERGIATTVAAVARGACIVERHITLDRTMYGSDQAASLEPSGFARLVRDIRAVEAALGDGVKRAQPGEDAVLAKLRRIA